MESLGSLAGGVAHDMNNVLGAILSLASAHLAIQEEGSQVHQAFETICEAATRGGKMVRSLLTFARRNPAEVREVDLNTLLQQNVGLLEHTTLAKVRLETHLDPTLHPIRGDASALTNAFMNLCVNAVDAMPGNGILAIRTRNVPGHRVEVEIEDTGHGMTPEVLAKAMDPFFTTKETGKGTGLGLSLVYSTVQSHKGTMEIHSAPGAGTRIVIAFPACETTPGADPAPAREDLPPPPGRALRVLVVDDDELIRKSSRTLMEVLGHDVVTAAGGEEALDALRKGLVPDLVILDMNMPGLGGAGTLPRLRALLPEVPVILATGRANQEALSLVERHPGVSLLAKPFSLADLGAMLRNLP
jgi:CheY-like chemotaxis protein/anti-sigma regulatory factor (Ser/Thr protein kinase)